MHNETVYCKIYDEDYEELTKIMTSAFNEDTSMHTELKEDGPTGYDDGSLIKLLNEHENFESKKIIYNNTTVGAYTVGIKPNNEYSLEMLFIDPKYRKNHLGSIVWTAIEDSYMDAKKWTVETPCYSNRNHHFYTEKCGFVFHKQNICDNGCISFVFDKTTPANIVD